MPALATPFNAVEATSDYTIPFRRHLYAVFEDDDFGSKMPTRDSTLARILYSALTCLPLLITCYLFWRRVKEVRWQTIQHISWIRFLVYGSYIISIAFFVISISISGAGIHTPGFCRTAIYFCIAFLFCGKLFMQMFLIERAHVANINYLRRRDDPVWIISTLAVTVCGGFLIIWAFLNPVAFIANNDGRCRKGLPSEVVAPLEIYECVTYILLTTVFIIMLRRTRQCELFPKTPERFNTFGKTFHQLRKNSLRTSALKKSPSVEEVEIGSDATSIILPPSTQPCKLRGLAFKSLIGTILILGWGVINSTIFYITDGKEHVWLCFMQCTMEIFLSVCVLHWLTANPKEFELTRRGTRPSIAELPVFLGGDSISQPAPVKLSRSSSTS